MIEISWLKDKRTTANGYFALWNVHDDSYDIDIRGKVLTWEASDGDKGFIIRSTGWFTMAFTAGGLLYGSRK